ncbi:hypothetical protein [Ruegeria sp. Alg231-54]|uniref:hypothetical protein n=1 Tax=Ruegeria sp. Alg231-54 TaxID=1922221 RepID=UPI000D55A73E|nr:hypothetical protein [Ruegeria sp. Alg231-54]
MDPNVRELFQPHFRPLSNEIWNTVLGLKKTQAQALSFEALKVGQKCKKLDTLFNDADTRNAMKLNKAVKKRIDTWLPEAMG